MAINDKISNNLNTAKVAVRSLKNRLLSKLKFRMGGKPVKQVELDRSSNFSVESRHSEADDNALNEALEARLMELIASAPAQETPITLQLGVASDSASTTTPSSPISIDGYGWPVFNFASFPQYQTRCQDAQAQS